MKLFYLTLGDSIKDVKILCGQMLEAYQEQMNFKGVTHLITSMISNDRLLDVYRKEFVEPRREAFAYVLNRGQARGELREDLDIDLTIDLLGGLFVYELLFSPEKLLSENFLDRVESVLFKGLLK